ncbi:MAG: DegV family protein [Chloroflexota bacterium]
MLHIVTDGAADLPPAWEQEFDIHIIPINIQFGDKTYLQFVDMGFDDFYKKVEETKTIPKTSQPSPHQFIEFYKKIAKPGETILSMHVTSKLSGTYASAVMAAEELKDMFNIVPFDSAGGSMGLGFMCRTARQMDRAGKSVEEIVQHLESIRAKIQIFITLDKLDYARMSGRVGTLSAALASVLNVKPIAILKDGIVNMTDKVRTRKASLERILELGRQVYGSEPVHLAVVHARDLASGQALLDQAKKVFNVQSSELTDLSIALAINFGPGTVGLVLYPA